MNIFHLHKDPKTCAEYHCDKHVVKMILETGQMLSTAYRRNFGDNEDLYKTAYPKHPMTIWVGDTGGNFKWTMQLFDELLYQYELRYNKIHKTSRILNLLNNNYTEWKEWKGLFTDPALCMPDGCKRDCYIFSYRKYYVEYKKPFARYTEVATPDFMC